MKAFTAVAGLAILSSLASAGSFHSRRNTPNYASITLTRINQLTALKDSTFQVIPGTIYYDDSNIQATDLELTTVDVNVVDATVTPRNVTCRSFTDEYGITPQSASFGGFAGAAAQLGNGEAVDVGYVLCLVNDGEGDCAL